MLLVPLAEKFFSVKLNAKLVFKERELNQNKV